MQVTQGHTLHMFPNECRNSRTPPPTQTRQIVPGTNSNPLVRLIVHHVGPATLTISLNVLLPQRPRNILAVCGLVRKSAGLSRPATFIHSDSAVSHCFWDPQHVHCDVFHPSHAAS